MSETATIDRELLEGAHDALRTPAMARPLMAVASQIVEPLRGFAYAAALSGDDDDDTAALLRYLGRRPGWAR